MNQADMLKQLGISLEQFNDLFQKFQAFFNSLDDQQKQVLQASLPTLKEAADAFGPGVNESDLLQLFQGDAQRPPITCFLPIQQNPTK